MTKIVKSLRSGQLTIPVDFREKLGINGDTLLKITLMDGELRIKPVKAVESKVGSPWIKELYDYFAPVRKELGKYSEKEINDAIDKAVKAVRKKHAKSGV